MYIYLRKSEQVPILYFTSLSLEMFISLYFILPFSKLLLLSESNDE